MSAVVSRTGGRHGRLVRPGQVVETEAGPVVRFLPECGRADGACALCGSGRGRGAGGAREIPLAWIAAGSEVRAGERVQVAVAADALTRLAVRLFGIPLMALVAGAWLGHAVAARAAFDPDLLAAGTGLICLAVAALAAARGGSPALHRLGLTIHRQGKNQ